MLRTTLLSVALLLPLSAFGADFSAKSPYRDVRTSSREFAGINLFTNEGIVSGVKPGYFGPSRRITRGEFLKIAVRSALPQEHLSVSPSQKACVRDIDTGSWLHPYACLAREHRAIGQGAFFPARDISYGEALKILTSLYGYTVTPVPNRDWAEPYYQAAANRFVDLPMTIRLDTALTRAQAVRLAAAFMMESRGMLDEYRLAESGQSTFTSSSSSSSSSALSSSASSVSSSAASSASVSSSSSSASTALYSLPPSSRFLIAGSTTDALASVVIPASSENRLVLQAQVKLFQEATALKSIQITTERGDVLATLTRRTTTDLPDYKQIYDASIAPEQGFVLEKNTAHRLIVRAVVRSQNDNGAAEQVVAFRSISISTVGQTTAASDNHVFLPPFPQHQTSLAKLTSVKNVGPANGTLASGAQKLVGAFSFEGITPHNGTLSIEELIFSPAYTGQVMASNWKLLKRGSTESVECSTGLQGISCSRIPASLGTLGSAPLVFELYADVQVFGAAGTSSLQMSLPEFGSPVLGGSIGWSDGAGHYHWVEGSGPIAVGTLWK